MAKTIPYQYMDLTVVRATKNPSYVVRLACDITMKNISQGNYITTSAKPELLKQLYIADHTSIFEHVGLTILIEDVSRSFLAQITRHRMASYTAASQHYQNYEDYVHVLSDGLVNHDFAEVAINICDDHYNRLVNEYNIPPEEARQVLPNSKAVNIMWSINARSLLNFFKQRLCKRNVKEMLIFSEKLYKITMDWWPELFQFAGPHCKTYKFCNQGRMQAECCKRKWQTYDEFYKQTES